MEEDKKSKFQPKIWFAEQEIILKEWGEACSGYRYLHYKAFEFFRKRSLRFTLPVIVISTIAGTANFANESVPVQYRRWATMSTGVLNLVAGIIATISQFLKVNELMESHRVSYISYNKLSRNIRLELELPARHRNMHGTTMIQVCKLEYDRLTEQSPIIPKHIIDKFKTNFGVKERCVEELKNIHKPEILTIYPIVRATEYVSVAVGEGEADLRSTGYGGSTEDDATFSDAPSDVNQEGQNE